MTGMCCSVWRRSWRLFEIKIEAGTEMLRVPEAAMGKRGLSVAASRQYGRRLVVQEIRERGVKHLYGMGRWADFWCHSCCNADTMEVRALADRVR